jgi:hypothetical protein
LVFVLQ